MSGSLVGPSGEMLSYITARLRRSAGSSHRIADLLQHFVESVNADQA